MPDSGEGKHDQIIAAVFPKPLAAASQRNVHITRNQVDSEMCQRRQNSLILFEIYGSLKFSRKWNPKIRPNPMAISE